MSIQSNQSPINAPHGGGGGGGAHTPGRHPSASAGARGCARGVANDYQPPLKRNEGESRFKKERKNNNNFKVINILSGIDTLNLSISLRWKNTKLLETLHALLEEAKKQKSELPFTLPEPDGMGQLSFMVQPHGKQGYTWLLIGKDYCLRVMDWIVPKSRPSIIAELKSELLWRLGPVEAVQRLISTLEHHDAQIFAIKPSRVDLCMDVLFPPHAWNINLLDHMVTRASNDAFYREHSDLTGISIGRGDISARLYDKPREIASQSKKIWFYDLWKLGEVPEDILIIRIEFQLRREVLRDLGCNDLKALFQGLPHLWAYCTEKWLKFQSNPGSHHSKRRTLPWWQSVQDSFLGICEGEPLIRAKAIECDTMHLNKQATGICSSLIALHQDSQNTLCDKELSFADFLTALDNAIIHSGKTQSELQEDVKRKRIKKTRLFKKLQVAVEQRARLGIIE